MVSRHHIRKRVGSTGKVSWYATVELSRDPLTGKRRQRHVSGPTRKACEAEIARLVDRDDRGESALAARITIGELLDRWLEAKRATVKKSTHRSYRAKVETHLKPTIGHIRLAKLTPLHVQDLMDNLVDRCESATTAHHVYGVLNAALKQAIKWMLVAYNVSALVERPKRDTPEMTVWTAEEAARFLAMASDHELEPLWRLAITTGMRRGELVGLKWQDVDLQRGVVSIRRALIDGDHRQWEESTPKTPRSRRSIAIGADVVASLTRLRDRQRMSRLPNDGNYLFIDERGGVVTVTRITYQYKKMIRLSGVTPIRFHDMRHTCATLLLAAGESYKSVQDRLGHATAAMLLDRYAHVTPAMGPSAAALMDDIVRTGS